jgi:DNA-binding beta-propeller fold protein YncE
MRGRLVATAAVAATLLGGGSWATLELTSDDENPSADAQTGWNERFLELTDDGPQPPAFGEEDDEEFEGVADAGEEEAGNCAEDEATLGMTPNGWCIRPAGRTIDVLRFPLGILPVDGGSKVVVTSNSGGAQGLTVIDSESLTAVPTTEGNLFMGLAPTADGRLYAAGGNSDRVFRFRVAGNAVVSQDATEQATFPIHNGVDGEIRGRLGGAEDSAPVTDGIRVPGYPGPMLRYGKYVFVAGTLSEPSTSSKPCPGRQPACARVTVLDSTSDTVVGRIPVGLDAIGLAVDAQHKRLYVANWGDEAGRGHGSGGTVSAVSLRAKSPARWHETSHVVVGHHPSALQLSLNTRRLFVANTNDDTMSVLDVSKRRPTVRSTQTLSPSTGAPVGAHPDAFALSPNGSTLFVALAGMNAVEVRDGRTGQRLAGAPIYIPTGWYPSALAVTKTSGQHYRLWVTNAKGAGPGFGANGSVLFDGSELGGSVTAVDLPVSAKQQNRWTQQTVANDRLTRGAARPCAARPGLRVSQVLCPPGNRTSPIKHVVYIVTENKTFDQYFGDMDPNEYDADPQWLLYGRANTPNHHAIADDYSLGDTFYSDAEVSVTGHSWTSGAIATDHNERTWPADYDEGIRGNHGNSDPLRGSLGEGEAGGLIDAAEDELEDPEGGFIFEAFRRAGAVPPTRAGPGRLSMGIYGEGIARESGDTLLSYMAPHWKDGDIEYYDTCRAKQFISGKAPENLFPYNGRVGNGPPAGASAGGCEGRKLPGAFTLAKWKKTYKATGRDTMPSFIYMSLPDNHTLATNLGSPTPQSMVADNDYAIGLIVDALSRSPFWRHTVVIQTEDDTQVAADHISALRDYLLVASPWAKPGANHQWGSMPALLRTIEQIFGVEPISLFDRLALPMHEAFLPRLSDKPNMKRYKAIRPAVPFALNQADAPGAALSARMDCLETYDQCDEAMLNAILYAAIRGRPLHEAAWLAKLDRLDALN